MKPVNTYNILPFDNRASFIWPSRARTGDAGLDLYFCPDVLQCPDHYLIPPGETFLCPTGVKLELPSHLMGLVLSRSGLATKGVFIANAPGLIDPGYRGEVFSILYNGGNDAYNVKKGDRVGQLLVLPVSPAVPLYIQDGSAREGDGIGSSGV